MFMHIYKNHFSILITNPAAAGLISINGEIMNELLWFRTDV